MRPLALRLMQLSKIHRHYYSFKLVLFRLIIVLPFYGLGPVNYELLRDGEWLYNDVGNSDIIVRDLQFVPGFPFIVRIEDLRARDAVLRHDYKATVITDFVNVRTSMYLLPIKATVSRKIG